MVRRWSAVGQIAHQTSVIGSFTVSEQLILSTDAVWQLRGAAPNDSEVIGTLDTAVRGLPGLAWIITDLMNNIELSINNRKSTTFTPSVLPDYKPKYCAGPLLVKRTNFMNIRQRCPSFIDVGDPTVVGPRRSTTGWQSQTSRGRGCTRHINKTSIMYNSL